LINRLFCPDNVLLVGYSGSFAQCPVSALAGRHDNGNLICLTRAAVNSPNPRDQVQTCCKSRILSQKTVVFGTAGHAHIPPALNF
jgi:hypothetical protein